MKLLSLFIVVVATATLASGCSVIPVTNDLWVNYDHSAAGSTYPEGTKAYFVCSGDSPRRGDAFASCAGGQWTGGAVCLPPLEATNVARSGTATQSSTYNQNGRAVNANDGNRSGDYGDKSCTHSLRSSNPWWTVDLGGSKAVQLVRIYNRIDSATAGRLLGAQVLVGSNGDPRSNAVVATISQDQIRQNPIEVPLSNVMATHVTIRIPGYSKFLSICEVEVYA